MTMILSDLARRLPGMVPNPWQRFADDWPDVGVSYADLGHRWGVTRWPAGGTPQIVLHEGLNQVKRRCVLAHELEHLDRGAPCRTLKAQIERRVINATAVYLLPDLELVARTIAVYDLRRAAEELWVTWQVLVERLNALTDAESDYVHSRRDAVA